MFNRHDAQGNLFSADNQFLEFVGEDSFYGFLARYGRELFPDDEFASFYCEDFGRPSVPPSTLAIALLLQAYDRVSDAEAAERAAFDMRWKVALGAEMDERPFAKSTFQLFRAQLMVHKQVEAVFQRSLQMAREMGYLKGRKARIAVDSTYVLGRGAVEDAYNLIAHGIRKLCMVLAEVAEADVEQWVQEHGLERFFGSSIKVSREVDWDDAASREAFLTELVADGQRVLEIARDARAELAEGSEKDRHIADAAELLSRLLWQDIEPTDRGYRIAKGTTPDRVPSVEDPEQRHGHKSHRKSFTGHKLQIAVELETQLITAVDTTPGNMPDGEAAMDLVEASEANAEVEVEQVIGDTAYGSMQVRKDLGDREAIAPTVKGSRKGDFGKQAFDIDLDNDCVKCPAGHTTHTYTWRNYRLSKDTPKRRVKCFAFDKNVCGTCPHYEQCVGEKRGRWRTITLHPEEGLLQQARALEQTAYFREVYRERVVVEHRIGRLVQLGMRQSRFFGRAKTQFQALMAATVANLTLVANWLASEDGFCGFLRRFSAQILHFGLLWLHTDAQSKSQPRTLDNAPLLSAI